MLTQIEQIYNEVNQEGLNKVLRVNQQDVFDYAIYFKDGVIKGHSTGELLKQMK